jgi:hypothetical protein
MERNLYEISALIASISLMIFVLKFTFKSEDSHKFDQIHTIHCVDVDPISRNTEKLVTNFYTDGLKSKYQVPEGKTFFLIDVFFDEYGGYYFEYTLPNQRGGSISDMSESVSKRISDLKLPTSFPSGSTLGCKTLSMGWVTGYLAPE